MGTFAVPLAKIRRGLQWARSLAMLQTVSSQNVYHTDTGQIRLPLVEVHLPVRILRKMEMCVGMPDKELLCACSTSPPFEGPAFCEGAPVLTLCFASCVDIGVTGKARERACAQD